MDKVTSRLRTAQRTKLDTKVPSTGQKTPTQRKMPGGKTIYDRKKRLFHSRTLCVEDLAIAEDVELAILEEFEGLSV